MIGIELMPAAFGTGTVYVIPARHPVAAEHVGLLPSETRIIPVFAECQAFLDTHRVDKKTASAHTCLVAAGAYDPIAYSSAFSNFRFASCQGAITVEWVRCEAAVICNNITMKDRHDVLIIRTDVGE